MRYGKVVDHASEDENPEPIGYATAVAAGVEVAGIRKAYTYWDTGHKAWVTLTDDCFARDAPVARAAGATVLAYYAPPYYAGAPAPEELAATALAAGAPLIRGKDFPLCLDLEWGPQGFKALGLDETAVLKLITRHVNALRNLMGCPPIIYTSYNEMYDLGLPAVPELADTWFWCKTAYPVEAGEPPYTKPIEHPHVGEAGWDPHEYFTIPRPWTSYLIQQTQGDARGFPGFRQCDLGVVPVAQLGDTGPQIVALQRQMVRAGLQVVVDGDFGPHTEAALRYHQQSAGLVPSGEATPSTMAALLWH